MNNKNILVLISVALLTITSINLNAGWGRTYGGSETDKGFDIETTSDGKYLVTGVTYSFGNGNADYWLLKFDESGDTLWSKTCGGASWDESRCVQEARDGGFVVVGNTTSFGAGGADIWLLKIDQNGDTVWTKTYGWEDGDYGYSIVQTSDDGYLIAGKTFSFGAPEYEDLLLIKTDSFGDTIWTKVLGGEGRDIGFCVKETPDGNCIISGVYNSNDRDWYGYLWILKIDTSGEIIWERTYHDGFEGDDWRGQHISSTEDGGLIITGCIRDNAEGAISLWKTDSLGNMEWYETFETDAPCWGECVQQTADKGYIITSLPWPLIKTDSSGNLLWKREHLDYDGCGYSVLQLHDDGYIVTGYRRKEEGVSSDLWLLKVDSLGQLAVEEPITPTVTHQSELFLPVSVGQQVTLRYSNYQQGFHAEVFDASGCKVDEIRLPLPSGTISWGGCYGSGVYFMKPVNGTQAHKVILIK